MKNKAFAVIYVILFIVLLTVKYYLHPIFDVYLIINFIVDLISLIVSYIIIKNIKNNDAKYTSFYVYQFISSILLYALSSLIGIIILYVPQYILLYFLLLVIIYSINGIMYIIMKNTEGIVKNINEEKNKKTHNWKACLITLECICDEVKQDPNYEKLLELYKYSDPINKEFRELDEEIFNDINNLAKNYNAHSVLEIIKKIELRNKKVKLSK